MTTGIIAVVCCGLMATSLMAAGKLEAEKATMLGQACPFADPRASGAMAVKGLGERGSGLRSGQVRAARKLAIRYASRTSMGTYTVQVNDQPPVKVNLHSTGAWDTYHTDAIIDVSIPSGATLRLLSDQGDGEWSIGYVLLGNDDLGLKPDIWNLPRLTPANGRFTPDWRSLEEHQTPEWFLASAPHADVSGPRNGTSGRPSRDPEQGCRPGFAMVQRPDGVFGKDRSRQTTK